MQSQREDGRGHWTPGKRRNEGPPPKGWDSIDEFLAEVLLYCQATRQLQALADELGVHRKTVGTWLTGGKWPCRSRRTQIARWYRRRQAGRSADTPRTQQ